MSLARKITLYVLLAFAVSGALSYVIQQAFIMPSFVALEEETAIKNTSRVVEALNRELAQLHPPVSDWAFWTDTYNFVLGTQPEYKEANLTPQTTLSGLNVNYMGIFDVSGKVKWSAALDLESGELIEIGKLTRATISSQHPFLQHGEQPEGVIGCILTDKGPLLAAAKPILTTEKKGPSVGTFVMGRILNKGMLKQLAEQTKLVIRTSSPAEGRQGARVAEKTQSAGAELLNYTPFKKVVTDEKWEVSFTIMDVHGKPLLTFQVDTPRSISRQGALAVTQSLWMFAGTATFVMLMLWMLLQRSIVRPISKLTDHAMRIGENDNLQVRLNLDRKDEVGLLGRTLDKMVESLAEARRRLVDQSYHYGVSEMAADVLHSIGNTLTPLDVTLVAARDTLRAFPSAEVEQASSELDNPVTSQDRRAALEEFLGMAGRESSSIVKTSEDHVSQALEKTKEIQSFLAAQEGVSRSEKVLEPVNISDVIRNVESGLPQEMQAVLRVEVDKTVVESPPVFVAHAPVLKVVADLIFYVAESVATTGRPTGRLTIAAAADQLQGKDMVHFRFADNDAGLDEDQAKQVFQRNVSSNDAKEGKRIALHWSANIVKNMGGELYLESEGVGKGACFHLLLPCFVAKKS